jgi:hypothetical protein
MRSAAQEVLDRGCSALLSVIAVWKNNRPRALTCGALGLWTVVFRISMVRYAEVG